MEHELPAASEKILHDVYPANDRSLRKRGRRVKLLKGAPRVSRIVAGATQKTIARQGLPGYEVSASRPCNFTIAQFLPFALKRGSPGSGGDSLEIFREEKNPSDSLLPDCAGECTRTAIRWQDTHSCATSKLVSSGNIHQNCHIYIRKILEILLTASIQDSSSSPPNRCSQSSTSCWLSCAGPSGEL